MIIKSHHLGLAVHALKPIASKTCELMRELGQEHLGQSLQDFGWTFRWDGAKRRLGACHPRKKAISLSKHFAWRNGWTVMEDVARHEIAHALHFEADGGRGHGPGWKRWAEACGADPTRLYEGEELETVDSKYVAVCPKGCGYALDFHRMIKRWYICPACTKKTPGEEKAVLHLKLRASGRTVREGGMWTSLDRRN